LRKRILIWNKYSHLANQLILNLHSCKDHRKSKMQREISTAQPLHQSSAFETEIGSKQRIGSLSYLPSIGSKQRIGS
jgi:hypothetical protein